MSILQALILGVVQGITEFLPVSSSGHLILVPSIFGWEVQDVAFDAVMHLATLAAVFTVFWAEVKKIARGMLSKKPDFWGRLGWIIIVGTIPISIIGLTFKDVIETSLRTPAIVAASLVFWGIILYMADRLVMRKPIEKVEKTGWKEGIFIGIAQAMALVPGTSRSGITMSAGMLAGLNRRTAAAFSFLLGVPAIAAAGFLSLGEVVSGSSGVGFLPIVVGFITAFVSGLFAIRYLLKLLEKKGFLGFAIYRIALGLLVWIILV